MHTCFNNVSILITLDSIKIIKNKKAATISEMMDQHSPQDKEK